MAINWQKPGINHVGEFQMTGHILPVAKNSDNQTVHLNYVAKAITFTNEDSSVGNIKIYDRFGVASTTVSIGAGETVKVDGKFLKFEIVGDHISAMVEVTNIPSGSYHQPSFATLATITTP